VSTAPTGPTWWRALWSPQLPRRYVHLLAVSKLADSVTTAVGLLAVPGLAEGNPAIRALIARLGVLPALAVVTVGVVVLVVATTEAGVRCSQRLDGSPRTRGLIRSLGYLPLSALFLAAAVHNAVLLARALS
jgi:hypothetical protein